MLEFRNPELSDRAWVTGVMERSGDMACEYCFGNLYIWAPVYENTICEYDGMFLARDGVGDPMYLYPCGDGDKKAAVNELIRYAENHDGARLTMYCLTPSNVRELEDMMPGKFEFTEMREFADYIYNTTDLIDLAGRKYHGKRNHIAYFKNNHDWHFEPINDGNMQYVLI